MGNRTGCCLSREDDDEDHVPVRSLTSLALDERFCSVSRAGERVCDVYTDGGADLQAGGFASVKTVLSRKTGEACALKVVNTAKIPEKLWCNEIEICSGLSHPHVVRLLDIYEDRRSVYLVMELCRGGDLVDFVRRRHRLPEIDVLHLAGQLMWAVAYLHAQCVAHRDIKLDNLLLKDPIGDPTLAQLKVIDFGLSKRFERGNARLRTRSGSSLYVAPEVLVGIDPVDRYYDERCDIWSCGVVLYMLLSRRAPFDGADHEEILDRVLRAKVRCAGREWKSISEETKSFVLRVLTRSVEARPSAGECAAAVQGLRAGAACESNPQTPKRADGVVAASVEPTASERSDDAEGAGRSGEDALLRSLQAFRKRSRLQRHARFLMARHMDEASVRHMQDVFKRMDTKGTGTITLEDFKHSMAAAGHHDAQLLDELFMHCDGDSSQDISYTEFLAVVMERGQSQREALCWEAFRRIDKDGDGQITTDDLMGAMPSADSRLSPREAEAILRDADLDGDGAVSFTEFVKMMEQSPSARGSPRSAIDAELR